jgi:soluble lytic murein transglycosylase-like protein
MARILPASVFKANFNQKDLKPSLGAQGRAAWLSPGGVKTAVEITDAVGGTISDAVSRYARKQSEIARLRREDKKLKKEGILGKLYASGEDEALLAKEGSGYEAAQGEVLRATTREERAAGYDKMRKAFDKPGSGRLLSDPSRAPSRLVREDYAALAKASPLDPATKPSGLSSKFFPKADAGLGKSLQNNVPNQILAARSVRSILTNPETKTYTPVDLYAGALDPAVRQQLLESGYFMPHKEIIKGTEIDTVTLKLTDEQQNELRALTGVEADARKRQLYRANFARAQSVLRNAGNPNLDRSYQAFKLYQNTFSQLQQLNQLPATPENIKTARFLQSQLAGTRFALANSGDFADYLSFYGEDDDGSGTSKPKTPVDALEAAAKVIPTLTTKDKAELAELAADSGTGPGSPYAKKLAEIKESRKPVAPEYYDSDEYRASTQRATDQQASTQRIPLVDLPEFRGPSATQRAAAQEFAGRFSGEDEAALQAVYPESQRNIEASANIARRLSDPSDPAYASDSRGQRPARSDLGLGDQEITRAARDAVAIRRPGYEPLISSDTSMMPREKVQRRKRLERLEAARKPQREATDARTLAARRRATVGMARRPMPLTAEEAAGKVQPLAPLAKPKLAAGPKPSSFKRNASFEEFDKLLKKHGTESRLRERKRIYNDYKRGEYFEPNKVKYPNKKEKERLKQIVIKAAKKNKVEPWLMLALVAKESGFRPTVISNSNALGIAQTIPSTFKSVMGKNVSLDKVFDPEIGAEAGARYLAQNIKKYAKKGRSRKEQLQMTLAAYNAGPEKLKEFGLKLLLSDRWAKIKSGDNKGKGATRIYVEGILANMPKEKPLAAKKKKGVAGKPGPKAPKEGS